MKKTNPSIFKKALGAFPTGVAVMTINDNNIFIGKTVNSFASLSLKPPLVLFSLDKKSSSLEKYKKSKNIGINILSSKQKSISIHFANKNILWGKIKFFLLKNKIPMITSSLANMYCKIIKNYSEGDHVIFICKVEEIKVDNSLKPLIYYKKKYL
tara:strand:+ start:947 stop:1411 length:465 start_codon:yes stop_codon:yes gene_type:complete